MSLIMCDHCTSPDGGYAYRELLDTYSTPSAVLDLHFSPHYRETLAVAMSTGVIELYVLHINGDIFLEKAKTVQAFDPSILVLSLAWHPSPQRVTTLAVSLSDGNVALLEHDKDPAVIRVLEAHSLEAWTVAWSPIVDSANDCSLYSGGDDSTLRFFTANQLGNEEMKGTVLEDEAKLPIMRPYLKSKIHEAGVTAILPLCPSDDPRTNILITGSYDEKVRVLVLDPNGRWKSIAEKCLKGGVWRLKLLTRGTDSVGIEAEETSYHVLASCMHAGAKILGVCSDKSGAWSIKVLGECTEHESMNYGSDATGMMEAGGISISYTVVSTSFYDRKLCIWTLRTPARARHEICIPRLITEELKTRN